MRVLYTAAHGGFAREHAPLGGGAAIFEMLLTEWERTKPFDWSVFTPHAVTGHDITGFSTGAYARFCRKFEKESTYAIRQCDAANTIVLVNDIAEGPDFAALREYRLVTIWHVDVVAYIAAIYCRGLAAPETLVRLHRVLGGLYPDILRIIFEKQRQCVQFSAAHIVPSASMKRIILRCYPQTDPDKIHVLPWGAPPAPPRIDKQAARQALGIAPDALVLLTLSRLSPEKNQQLLLEALGSWEREGSYPPVVAIICGGAAYMQGQQHEALLRGMAAKLRKTEVRFPGHVHGVEKQLYFSAADLYVFPSSHESYGLTLMEAFQYGLPAITLENTTMRPEFGVASTTGAFARDLQRMSRMDLAVMGRAAQAFAQENSFDRTADRLAGILTGLQSK